MDENYAVLTILFIALQVIVWLPMNGFERNTGESYRISMRLCKDGCEYILITIETRNMKPLNIDHMGKVR